MHSFIPPEKIPENPQLTSTFTVILSYDRQIIRPVSPPPDESFSFLFILIFLSPSDFSPFSD